MDDFPATPSAIFAVVLAAGASRRFGDPKLLESLGGDTLVGHAARVAESCCGTQSVLVTGHHASAIAAAASGRCRIVLENPRYRDGIGTSIALAARELQKRADAILLLLADQPLVDTAHLRRVLAAWSGHPGEIVATGFAGTKGPPVLLPRATFAALVRLDGDRGARDLMSDPAYTLQVVQFEAAAVDVDTVADLERLRNTAGSAGHAEARPAQRSQFTQPE